jgi:hypothetical protein
MLLGSEHAIAMHKHVDEIDTCNQFHQHCTLAFYVRECFEQLVSSYILVLQFFGRKKYWQKGARKILMKLTPAEVVGHQVVPFGTVDTCCVGKETQAVVRQKVKSFNWRPGRLCTFNSSRDFEWWHSNLNMCFNLCKIFLVIFSIH